MQFSNINIHETHHLSTVQTQLLAGSSRTFEPHDLNKLHNSSISNKFIEN